MQEKKKQTHTHTHSTAHCAAYVELSAMQNMYIVHEYVSMWIRMGFSSDII